MPTHPFEHPNVSQSALQISIPHLCAWCGSENPINDLNVVGIHREKFGLIIYRVKTESINLQFPICQNCLNKIEKGRNVFIPIWILSSILLILFGYLTNEEMLICFFYSVIFGAAISVMLNKFFVYSLGFQDRDGWGSYDGNRIKFKNKKFSKEFYNLNPFLNEW